jgi:hypothetical protein
MWLTTTLIGRATTSRSTRGQAARRRIRGADVSYLTPNNGPCEPAGVYASNDVPLSEGLSLAYFCPERFGACRLGGGFALEVLNLPGMGFALPGHEAFI